MSETDDRQHARKALRAAHQGSMTVGTGRVWLHGIVHNGPAAVNGRHVEYEVLTRELLEALNQLCGTSPWGYQDDRIDAMADEVLALINRPQFRSGAATTVNQPLVEAIRRALERHGRPL